MPKQNPSAKKDTTEYLDLLPEELWLKVLSYLDEPKDLVNVSESCKVFQNVAEEESLWRGMNKRYGVNYTELEGAKNNFIQIYKDQMRLIEQRLNELLATSNTNVEKEQSLIDKVQRHGYLQDELLNNLIPKKVETSLDKATQRVINAKLLWNYISKHTHSIYDKHYNLFKKDGMFEKLDTTITLQGLLVELYNKCEFNQFIELASQCYEFALNSECPFAISANLCAILSGYINSLQENVNENKNNNNNNMRILYEDENEQACSNKRARLWL